MKGDLKASAKFLAALRSLKPVSHAEVRSTMKRRSNGVSGPTATSADIAVYPSSKRKIA